MKVLSAVLLHEWLSTIQNEQLYSSVNGSMALGSHVLLTPQMPRTRCWWTSLFLAFSFGFFYFLKATDAERHIYRRMQTSP